MHIKKNDQVLVLTGEYKGKRGKILKVLPDKNRIIVEGVNFIKRHMRPSQTMPQGGIIKKEAPIHVSNVMLIDPKTSEPTRIRYGFLAAEGKHSRQKVRFSKKSGEMIQDH
ncbi:MAG: 50S ribosomal protein L24 [bacterium]